MSICPQRINRLPIVAVAIALPLLGVLSSCSDDNSGNSSKESTSTVAEVGEPFAVDFGVNQVVDNEVTVEFTRPYYYDLSSVDFVEDEDSVTITVEMTDKGLPRDRNGVSLEEETVVLDQPLGDRPVYGCNTADLAQPCELPTE